MQYNELKGACHCGNICFVLEWPGPFDTIPARRCGCSFCQKHGGVWTSNDSAVLDVSVIDSSLVSRYRFGTETADFHVCSRCGCAPLVTSEIDGRCYAVINVNMLEGIERSALAESPTDFDGEDTGARLDRRKRNWIPQVRIRQLQS